MDQRKQIVEVLRKNGYKATSQRIAVAQTVLRSHEHPSAEDIHEEVLRIHPTVSLSTVYNTLHLLKDITFLRELTYKGTTRYDPNLELHINLICEGCGTIQDIEANQIKDFIDEISRRQGFDVTGQHIDIYGTCKKCRINTNT